MLLLLLRLLRLIVLLRIGVHGLGPIARDFA